MTSPARQPALCGRNYTHWGHDIEGGRCDGLAPFDGRVPDVRFEVDTDDPAVPNPDPRPSGRLPITREDTGVRTNGLPNPQAGVRDPWAFPVPYDVLHLGLIAIASDAVARGDHHTAAYAHSVLAGEPIPPQEDPEEGTEEGPETWSDDPRDVRPEDRAPQMFVKPGGSVDILWGEIPAEGLLVRRDEAGDRG